MNKFIEVTARGCTSMWISVKDGLPEDGKEVLCWYEYFRYGSYNRMFQTYGIGHCYNKTWCGEVANGTRSRVIAWMPLPEPPKRRKRGRGEKEVLM